MSTDVEYLSTINDEIESNFSNFIEHIDLFEKNGMNSLTEELVAIDDKIDDLFNFSDYTVNTQWVNITVCMRRDCIADLNYKVSGALVNVYGEVIAEIYIAEDIILNTQNAIQINRLNPLNGCVSVVALSPSDKRLICDVTEENENFVAQFIPNEIGKWQIFIEQDGKKIANSNNQPIYVKVFNPYAGKLIYALSSPVSIGQYYQFEVDCLHVGTDSVNLDVKVIHGSELIDCIWENSEVGKCRIGFTPKSQGTYEVNVFCGNVHFPGSPFNVNVSQSYLIQSSGSGLYFGTIGSNCEFKIDTSANPDKECEVIITSASNKVIPFTIDKIRNIISVTYVPTEIGVTTIEVTYDKIKLKGSPFVANIREPKIYVKRNLSDVYLGQKCSVEVDASEHTKGTIEVDSSLPVLSFEKVREKVYLIKFLPKSIGVHDVILKFGGQSIPGSPFQVTVKKQLQTLMMN